MTSQEFDMLGAVSDITPIPHTTTIEGISPLNLYETLCAEEPHSFLLESLEGEEKIARYSIIGCDPLLHFRSKGTSINISTREKSIEVEGDPIDVLKDLMGRFHLNETKTPVKFTCGGVGYFSYDVVRFFEDLPDRNPDDVDVPECYLVFPRIVVVFDHQLQSGHIIYNGTREENERGQSIIKTIESTMDRLRHADQPRGAGDVMSNTSGDLQSNLTREQFEKMVEKAREYIFAGDVFQVVLSQRFRARIESEPLQIFRALRRANPSPYMYYLNFNRLHIVGSSPEILVRVEDGFVETRPLAGTRPRGNSRKMDEVLMDELKNDEKEKAEHIMLVDLGRNDIGRVCDFGSVRVTELLEVEKYSHVMHLVSNVVGEFRQDRDAFDVLRATFPAGTVSGAPKVRAMELIDELEPVRRGIYAGAIGYVSFTGDLDACIAIRTIVVKDQTAFIQAGAGIVADSVPEREYEETLHKAQALFRAVEWANTTPDGE